jgi:integrase/recombinase XerD
VSFLYDHVGNRKYLTITERNAFLAAADQLPGPARVFCRTLAFTGARLSEVLALKPGQIDTASGVVIFESLKKRRRGVFRAVPIPGDLITDLRQLAAANYANDHARTETGRLWPWSRTTGWAQVKRAMALAGVAGSNASPKGVRHGFGVGNLQAGVPVTTVKKWLGHARLSTTEIYVDAVGEEEKALAKRHWATFSLDEEK